MDEQKARIAEILEEMQAISDAAGDAELTEEQQAQWDALEAEKMELEKEIEEAEAAASAEAERKRKIAQRRSKLNNDMKKYGTPKKAVRQASPVQRRTRYEIADEPCGVSRDNQFRSLGQFLAAVMSAGKGLHTDDVKKLRRGDEEIRNHYRAATGASEDIGSEGGFLLQPQFAEQLLMETYDTGLLSSRVTRIPIGPNAHSLITPGIDETSRAHGSRFGGLRAYWSREAAAMTASQPKFKRVQINLDKLTGLMYMTDELLSDATALGAIVGEAFPSEFSFMLDDAIINGTGAGEPLGVMHSGALISVAKEGGQAADTIQYENVVKMYARMYSRGMQNAVWVTNQDCLPQLFTMSIPVGTGGVPVYLPANGASGIPYNTLFGREIIFAEQAQTVGTTGDILFCDFSRITFIEKGGIETAESIHVKFVENETAFRWVLRTNGQPQWDKPLTPYKGSATVSPFVALASRD